MKRNILIIAAFLLSSCGVSTPITQDSQDFLHFHSDGYSVFWTEIYHYASTDSASIRDWYSTSFDISDNKPGRIVGKTRKSELPTSEVGLKPMTTTIILLKPCEAYFTVEFKEDRCRVTVSEIIWDTEMNVTTRSGGIAISQGAGTMSLSNIALSNRSWKSAFIKNSGPQLDRMLEYVFMPKPQQSNHSEW